MSSGALVQLAAIGQMNEYTTICPEITFFKGSYKRYTNFSRVPIANQFSSTCDWGRNMLCTVQRSGDLIIQAYLVMKINALIQPAQIYNQQGVLQARNILNDNAHWTNELGHAAILQVSVTIGGQKMDQWTGDFLGIWESLSYRAGKRQGSMVGYFTTVTDLILFSSLARIMYVPMMFWFNRCTEQALPLIALQYHETKFDVQLRPFQQLLTGTGLFSPTGLSANPTYYKQNLALVTGGQLTDCYFLINYVYCDTMERRIFATNAHEYLIDQLQYVGTECKPAGKTQSTIPLYFNHICKEFVWVIQRKALIDDNRYFDFSGVIPGSMPQVGDPNADPLISAKIQLNSHDLFDSKDAIYYRKVVPYEVHSDIPDYYIYVWSFALDPENWKPTGGCTLSRIDNVVIQMQYQDFEGEIRIYCRSLNLLKIISGMAGIKYAN